MSGSDSHLPRPPAGGSDAEPEDPGFWLATALWIYALVLFAVDFLCVFEGATEEPYFRLQADEAFFQVVVPTGLIVCWLHWLGGVAFLVVRRQLGRWHLVGAVVFALVGCFYAASCVTGYLGDLDGSVILGGPFG